MVWLGWMCTDTQTHRHTEVLIPEYPIRASAFQASACDMSGPKLCENKLDCKAQIDSVKVCCQCSIAKITNAKIHSRQNAKKTVVQYAPDLRKYELNMAAGFLIFTMSSRPLYFDPLIEYY